MKHEKNYIDEKGNYHNIENLTLAQIYQRGVEEGRQKERAYSPYGMYTTQISQEEKG